MPSAEADRPAVVTTVSLTRHNIQIVSLLLDGSPLHCASDMWSGGSEFIWRRCIHGLGALAEMGKPE
jgi:hypothetical protein